MLLPVTEPIGHFRRSLLDKSKPRAELLITQDARTTSLGGSTSVSMTRTGTRKGPKRSPSDRYLEWYDRIVQDYRVMFIFWPTHILAPVDNDILTYLFPPL